MIYLYHNKGDSMKDNNKRMYFSITLIMVLILAIIGATYAYFSASGGSNNNALTANSATLAQLGFTSSYSKISNDLIPVASENEYFSRYPGISASGDHSCLDDLGNQICSIYEFTITNTASVTQTIYVSFVPSENTFDNLYFAAFNTTIASANYEVATGSSGSGSNFLLTPQTTSGNITLGHPATKLTQNSTTPIDMPGLSTSLGAGESITYTALVWLQETGDNQNPEQGGVFKAGINVTTGGNSTGVTGVMGGNSRYVYVVYDGKYYTTASAAIAKNNDTPIYLKYKLNNPIEEEVWCIVGNNGSNSCYDDYYHTTSSSCQADLLNMPDDGTIYSCQTQTIITGGNIIEKYVEFTIDSETASANPGMTPGTYSLRGGDGGASYSENVNTITTAYGLSRCTDNTTSYRGSISQYNFAVVDSEGYVDVFTGAYACIIRIDGGSPYCYWD